VRPLWARVQLVCARARAAWPAACLSRLLPDQHARAACQRIRGPLGLLHRTPGGRVLKMPRPHGPASPTGLGACLRQQGHRWIHPVGAPARPRSCRPIHAAVHVSRSRAQAQRAPCAPATPAAADGLAHECDVTLSHFKPLWASTRARGCKHTPLYARGSAIALGCVYACAQPVPGLVHIRRHSGRKQRVQASKPTPQDAPVTRFVFLENSDGLF
jgi:hypothetical protein